MRFIIVICFICFAFRLSASGNKKWELIDCINYAMVQRSEIRKQELNIEKAAINYRYSKYKTLPGIYGEVKHTATKDKQFISENSAFENREDYVGSASLNADLCLFNGLETLHFIRESEFLHRKNKIYKEKLANDIILEVINAYFNSLARYKNVVIAKSFLENSTTRIKKVKIAVEAGKISEIDFLELEAQREKEKEDLISAQRLHKQALIELKKAMNIQQDLSLNYNSLVTDSRDFFKVDRDSVFRLALQYLPEFDVAKYDSLTKIEQLKQMKAQYYPSLFLRGTITSLYRKDVLNSQTNSSNYSFSDQFSNNFSQQLSIVLTIPVFSKYQVKRKVTETKIQFKQLNIEKEQLYFDVLNEIEQLCSERNKKQEKLESIKRRLGFYKEIFERRSEEFKLGVLSVTDYLISERNYKEAELQYSMARYDLEFIDELLNFYCGKYKNTNTN